MWKFVEGNIATPAGFRAAATSAGIKKASGSLDLALIVSDVPGTRGAAVFTTNRVAAAPVVFSRKNLAASRGRLMLFLFRLRGVSPRRFPGGGACAERDDLRSGAGDFRRRGERPHSPGLHRPAFPGPADRVLSVERLRAKAGPRRVSEHFADGDGRELPRHSALPTVGIPHAPPLRRLRLEPSERCLFVRLFSREITSPSALFSLFQKPSHLKKR